MDTAIPLMPSVENLDRSNVRFVYDVDLDEFTILFYGPDREAYAEPGPHLLSYLRDVETDEVVGVVFSQFIRKVLGEVPALRDLLFDADIIIDDFVGSLDSLFGDDPALGSRLSGVFHAARHARDHHGDGGQMHDVARGIKAFG